MAELIELWLVDSGFVVGVLPCDGWFTVNGVVQVRVRLDYVCVFRFLGDARFCDFDDPSFFDDFRGCIDYYLGGG